MDNLPGDGQQREAEQRAHDAEDEDGEEVVEERLMYGYKGWVCFLFVVRGLPIIVVVRPSTFLGLILSHLPLERGGLLQDDGREHCFGVGLVGVCKVGA